ncbi:DUF1704 domain-containing protein [bacterium]|nr:DUF1704 domain-containing protein [bacterium]
MSAASRIPISSLRRALKESVALRGRSESSACRFQLAKLVPYLAIAPHGGHRVRRDLARLLRTDEKARLREECPGTDRLVTAAPIYVAAQDSRLEYDIELPEEALARDGFFRHPPPAEAAAESLVRHREVVGVIEALATSLLERFGACLVFELTSFEAVERRKGEKARPPLPIFDFATAHLGDERSRFKAEIDAWRATLSQIRVLGKRAHVSEDAGFARAGALSRRLRALSPDVLVLPLAVRRVFMDERSQSLYPAVVKKLRRDLGRAMAKVATTFARAHTKWRPPHSAALRAGDIPELALEVDAALSQVSSQLRLLRYVNPVNAEQERQRFLAAGGDYSPRFRYRPLEFDPGVLKRRLYSVKVEEIEDPELERLYAAKRREIDLRIDLLAERGTPDFLLTSLKLYGRPEEGTLKDARALLELESEPEPRELTAEQVGVRLQEEVSRYAERDPSFRFRIRVKSGLASRVQTLEHRVELRAESAFSSRLAEGLAQHEVGVHALTTHNGEQQKLTVLRYGLPGSRRTQEGLAVFGEYRAGALTSGRLKTIGARAIVVGLLADGASFSEAVELARTTHGFELEDAYELVFRIYRGGGFAKDGIYLAGFLDVIRYWLAGRDLPTLTNGKVSIESASIVRDLVARGVLQARRQRAERLAQRDPLEHEAVMERARENEPVHVDGSPTRCPYCKDSFEDPAKVVACAACGARHHGACHSEHGRCASCGERDLLVPRAAVPAIKARREEPPRGSKIHVSREGDTLVYSWESATLAHFVISFLMLWFLPLIFVFLPTVIDYLKKRRTVVRVEPGFIEFPHMAWNGVRRVRARREDVGAIKTQDVMGDPRIVVDVGLERYMMKTGRLDSTIKPAEKEWLVQALQAWKEQG